MTSVDGQALPHKLPPRALKALRELVLELNTANILTLAHARRLAEGQAKSLRVFLKKAEDRRAEMILPLVTKFSDDFGVKLMAVDTGKVPQSWLEMVQLGLFVSEGLVSREELDIARVRKLSLLNTSIVSAFMADFPVT